MCAFRSENITGRAVVGIGLIALGVMLWSGISVFWPMFILVPGMAFLAAGFAGKKSTAGLFIPGMLISGLGALLLLTNITGYWESMSYSWTLFFVFLGMGLGLTGRMADDENLQRVGRGFMVAGATAFMVFAFLMEAVFNVGGGMGPVGWSLLLIAAGALILLRNMAGTGAGKSKRKVKNDVLFTGPVVYGSRYHGNGSRLSSSDNEARPVDRFSREQ